MSEKQEPSPLDSRAAFLGSVGPFTKLESDELLKLAEDFRERKYPRNTHLFHQEDSSTELYIIKTGKVRVYKQARHQNEVTIVVFGPKAIIGEFSVVDGQPRSTAAKTVEKCELLKINRERFLHHLRTVPDLGMGMCELLVSKARWGATYADTIAQYDGAGRFLRLMMQYNERLGRDTDEGKRVIDFGMAQSDLASLAGIGRSTLNRKLKTWSERGVISYCQKQIFLHDLDAINEELRALKADDPL